MINSYENIIIELFSMDFPNYHHCITSGNYYNYGVRGRAQSLDDYLIVKGIPDNFTIGDWIKYPSREYPYKELGDKVLGTIMYMEKVSPDYGEYILGIKYIDSNNGIIQWVNKFKQFVMED